MIELTDIDSETKLTVRKKQEQGYSLIKKGELEEQLLTLSDYEISEKLYVTLADEHNNEGEEVWLY